MAEHAFTVGGDEDEIAGRLGWRSGHGVGQSAELQRSERHASIVGNYTKPRCRRWPAVAHAKGSKSVPTLISLGADGDLAAAMADFLEFAIRL